VTVTVERSTIEPETMADIVNRGYDGRGYPCGCHPDRARPDLRFKLCDFHEGYDSGVALIRGRA
jgi:hypothetical protein